MTYARERLDQIGVRRDRSGRRKPYQQIQHSTRLAIRAAYTTPCECCGRRPSQTELAERFGVSQPVVWRAIHSPLIETYGRRNVPRKTTFRNITALQVAAMLCEGVDEGRRLARPLWQPEKPLQRTSGGKGT